MSFQRQKSRKAEKHKGRVAVGLSGGVDSAVSARAPKRSLVRGKLRVAVGLSGGVDSAVSAYLLKKQGYEVTGVFLECWRAPGCRTDEDRKDALEVALKLGIPFKVLDFKREYKERVVEYFYREYEAGRTPNPDTMCNREIKFGMFYDWALRSAQGKPAKFDYIATGHYARVRCTRKILSTKSQVPNKFKIQNSNGQTCFLARGIDKKKDQSYFLYQLRPDQLEHIIFPIGGMVKSEVRRLAKKLDLPVASKPDSQGICFIGEVDVRPFLKERIKPKNGEIIWKDTRYNQQETNKSQITNSKGLVVGKHEGVSFYTVGQRLGEELDQKKIAKLAKKGLVDLDPTRMPGLFVIEKDVEENVLYVGLEKELEVREFEVEDLNWLLPMNNEQETVNNVFVRIRHGGSLTRANLKKQKTSNKLKVLLDKPVKGVASGQACVLYSDDTVVLGGGVIA